MHRSAPARGDRLSRPGVTVARPGAPAAPDSVRPADSKRGTMLAIGSGGGAMHALASLIAGIGIAATPAPAEFAYASDSLAAWEAVRLGAGESLESRCGDAWQDVARFNRMDRRHAGPGVRVRMPRRLADVAAFQPLPAVVAEAESLERFVLVDLAEQCLGAYERGAIVFALPVTSGRRG